MKQIEIYHITSDVVDSLQASGISLPGQIRVQINPLTPPVLYGDPEGIRTLLFVFLSTITNPESGNSVLLQIESRDLPDDRAELQLSFLSDEHIFEEEQLRPFIDEVSGNLHLIKRDQTDGSSTHEILCSIPVYYSEYSQEEFRKKPEQPPILFDAIVREVQNPEIAMRILTEYISHLETQIRVIKQALEEENTSVIHREAHSIKGGALNIHASKLREAALALESAAKERHLEKGRKMLDNIRQAHSEIVDYIHSLRERQQQ